MEPSSAELVRTWDFSSDNSDQHNRDREQLKAVDSSNNQTYEFKGPQIKTDDLEGFNFYPAIGNLFFENTNLRDGTYDWEVSITGDKEMYKEEISLTYNNRELSKSTLTVFEDTLKRSTLTTTPPEGGDVLLQSYGPRN